MYLPFKKQESLEYLEIYSTVVEYETEDFL